jgi:hypothetical protein
LVRPRVQLVRPLAVVAALGCGSSEREPPARGQPDPLGAAAGKRSIDVSVDRAGVAIRGVEVTPGKREGELEVGYRVDATAGVRVPARVMCRVAERNVVYPDDATGKVAGPRLTSVFRPDPFRDPVRTCEIVFSVRNAEDGVDRPIARACWDGGELRDGACPATAFAPPPVTASGSVALERASLELHDATAVVTALYTLVEPLPAGRQFAAAIACKDAAGTTSGEGALAFVPLDTIPVGASIYGPLTVVLERTPWTPSPDASCDVRLVSRATSRVVDGGAPEQTHARYCITARAVRAGPC